MIDQQMMAAMVDEFMKIAMPAPTLNKALNVGPFSTNTTNRSSIKMKMPKLPAAPPPVGRVTTVGGSSIATGIPGANIKPPTTALGNRSALAGQETLRAGPGHIAQSTPAVPMTVQGQPPRVSTPAPTGGTLGGEAASPAAKAPAAAGRR